MQLRYTIIQNDCLSNNAEVQTETNPLFCWLRNLQLKCIECKSLHTLCFLDEGEDMKRYSIIKIYVKKKLQVLPCVSQFQDEGNS